ncbi:Calcineurin subunit B type 1 [Conglomerata obtusa]
MGFLSSRLLYEEELEELEETTCFTQQEIKILYERFKMLDRNNIGYITFNELMMLPEFHSNPLSGIMLNAIEDTLKYENMSFPYFLDILQIFSKKSDKKERIKFLFKAYDLNKDGKICENVLGKLYKTINGENCDDILMAVEVKRVLNAYDHGNKGHLSYKDFCRFYNSDLTIDETLIIEFSTNLHSTQ